ncbi:MAG: hypothetical protein II056_00780 [Paludibacteraceae bacterium]|nr:hypothetical protein [Paludibacteraceae bacterium]
MRKSYVILYLASLLTVLCLTSCDPDAKYYTKKVSIKIEQKRKSLSYVEAEFTTNKEAYYYMNILPDSNTEYVNLMRKNPKQFMSLMIDSAYVEYVEWRYSFLKSGVTTVADFASHSLRYGPVKKFFQDLKEGSKYHLFAFAVDAESNKPIGELYTLDVETLTHQAVNIHFNARVSGNWFYIYPLDEKNSVIDYSPYVWSYIDEEFFEEKYEKNPEAFLRFLLYGDEEEGYVDITDDISSMGIDVDNDNDRQVLEPGMTCYIIIASLDGGINKITEYKFVYNGPQTEFELIYGRDDIKPW